MPENKTVEVLVKLRRRLHQKLKHSLVALQRTGEESSFLTPNP